MELFYSFAINVRGNGREHPSFNNIELSYILCRSKKKRETTTLTSTRCRRPPTSNDRAYPPKRKELPLHHLHREQILTISILLSFEALPRSSAAQAPFQDGHVDDIAYRVEPSFSSAPSPPIENWRGTAQLPLPRKCPFTLCFDFSCQRCTVMRQFSSVSLPPISSGITVQLRHHSSPDHYPHNKRFTALCILILRSIRLRRFLTKCPIVVLARPPSAGYRLQLTDQKSLSL